MASSLAILTKKLGQVSLSQQTFQALSSQSVRTFAAGGLNKKKKNLERKSKKGRGDERIEDENVQHSEWVKFQQSIVIDGFETGQTTSVVAGVGQKKRGGKAVRKRMQNKNELVAGETGDKDLQLGGGQYPPLRYSEEETNRLLAEAYANIPERAGKRGTRNLQRQSNRWHDVRKARKVMKKNYGIKQHTRRMETRSKVVAAVKGVKADAPATRERDAAYQQHVMERWTQVMFGGDDDDEQKESA